MRKTGYDVDIEIHGINNGSNAKDKRKYKNKAYIPKAKEKLFRNINTSGISNSRKTFE